MSKTKKQIAADRTKRRANIRRGMRIALYEMKQRGVVVHVPSWFVPYTVAIAEAGRRGATLRDIADAIAWEHVRVRAHLAYLARVEERLTRRGQT